MQAQIDYYKSAGKIHKPRSETKVPEYTPPPKSTFLINLLQLEKEEKEKKEQKKEVRKLLVKRGNKYSNYVTQYFKNFKMEKFQPKPTTREWLETTSRSRKTT